MKSLELSLAASPVSIQVQLPDGKRLGAKDPEVRLGFKDRLSMVAFAMGEIGNVGAAIVEGRVAIDGSMRQLMAAAASLLKLDPKDADGRNWWHRVIVRTRSMAVHTLSHDARNIQFHYDLSDDFYALWLDPRRVYSCAYFRTPGLSLAQAQEAKLDHICRKLHLHVGERFLDVGAGWGALLLWAAENYGVDATGITLSRNQFAHVQRLIEQRGLASRVRVKLVDYRELKSEEPFDKIASVGMFEHVGRAQMVAYFRTVRELLAPGGLLMNHGITSGGVDNPQLGAGMGDFIERYIFPGGELMHVSTVQRDLALGGLEMVDTENLRPHYAKTLWSWSDALESQLGEAARILNRQHGDEQGGKALRAYRLYLAGCAIGFERGWISLHQLLAARPDGDLQTGAMPGAQSVYPFTRDYMYASPEPAPLAQAPGVPVA